MNRITPIEDPEEPVHRIAPYLEKLESPEAALGLQEMTTEFRELLEAVKAKAWVECLSSPEFLTSYKQAIRALLNDGTPAQVRTLIGVAQELLKHMPHPDPELEALFEEASRRINDGGPE